MNVKYGIVNIRIQRIAINYVVNDCKDGDPKCENNKNDNQHTGIEVPNESEEQSMCVENAKQVNHDANCPHINLLAFGVFCVSKSVERYHESHIRCVVSEKHKCTEIFNPVLCVKISMPSIVMSNFKR